LGLNLKSDIDFKDDALGLMFTSEVQYLIETGREDEIQEAQEAYDIPPVMAKAIISWTCRKYVSELLNLALMASCKYREEECVSWTKEILKYTPYFEGRVDADGLLFREEDVNRMIDFYESALVEEQHGGEGLEGAQEHEAIVRLRGLVKLTNDYKGPIGGIKGLLSETKTGLAASEGSIDVAAARKKFIV